MANHNLTRQLVSYLDALFILIVAVAYILLGFADDQISKELSKL